MTTQSAVKAIRPNRLNEDETLTSFEDWRNNLEFYLNQETSFKDFLKSSTVWKTSGDSSAEHRGLASADVARHLSQFLGVIASLAPPLLHGDIIHDMKSLPEIYKLLRSYYQFAPSEATFMKFASMKRDVVGGNLERPLHLYLRLRQFIRDNLLLKSGRIQHDGKVPDTNENMSPTTERLVVLRWLEILHPGLPAHVAQVFSQDLQTKSLKDLQPRIAEQIDDLLRQLETKDDGLDAQFSKISTTNYRPDKRFDNRRFSANNRRDDHRGYQKQFNNRETYTKRNYQAKKTMVSVKKCEPCRSVGEPFIGHDIQSCPNIKPSDRERMMQSFQLDISDDVEHEDDDVAVDMLESAHISMYEDRQNFVDVDRVNIGESPRFNVKLNKTMVTMLLDTGATGSMISLEMCEAANLRVYPSSHNATLADGDSKLQVVGEVHTSFLLDNYLTLPISAVVVTKLKAGFIVGMAFMERHEVVIDIPNSRLIFPGDESVSFNNKPGNPKLSLLRVEVSQVIFPGDTFSVSTPTNFHNDKTIAVEPREDNNWLTPSVVANDGCVVMQNVLDYPVKLRKNQVIAQIRSVVEPPSKNPPMVERTNRKSNKAIDFTSEIRVDLDNILSEKDRNEFQKMHSAFNTVFNPDIGTYNDKSGVIRASVCMGNNLPAPKKGKIPCYNSNNLTLLQEKFDELVELGVLSRPEEVNVDVIHTSPSFLVKKSDSGHRMVTSFVELNKYLRPLPTTMTTTEDVITGMGKWKFIIKTDLKSAYFQIPVKKESQKWLGTISPFKGMYVYNVAPQGLRNMAEYLEELVARVFGDFMAQSWFLKIADDLIIGANSISDLKQRWESVLQRLRDNNLSISAKKTYVCPTTVNIVGWIWKSGKLEVDLHRINPLTVCSPPDTVKQLRSFLGAARIVSRCIPRYAEYLSDLEELVAGKDSSDKLKWTETLQQRIKEAQKVLSSPKTITIPHPDDQLILVSDGCNSPPAVGSTLYVRRNGKNFIGGYFSAKIKKHQLLWLACEVEALCINLTINSFSNYIRESRNTTKFLTDSKACVDAFGILSKGGFSLSPRISSFLMNLNSLNVSINHAKGSDIALTDFSSRNPIICENKSCQVCQFVSDSMDIAVRSLTVDDVEKGHVKMPFCNKAAWRETQQQDPDLKRTFSQLSAGTRPGKKEKNLKNVRKYLQIASLSNDGTLVHRKPNLYGKDFELVIIPQSLVDGLVAALHLRFGHPFKSQLKKIFERYFYALDVEKIIDDCTESCSLCRSLKKIPRELFHQSSSEIPDAIGQVFSADVIRRENQKILLTMDTFSSFVLGIIIQNEQSKTLEQSLIHLVATYQQKDGCDVRVDNAPGFAALKNSDVLKSLGIKLDYGRIKNKNKNPTVDKAIQEVEQEIIRLMPTGGALTPSTLAIALSHTNNRIRSQGLSAKEILFKRDSITNEPLNIIDKELSNTRFDQRLKNHASSEKSKARGQPVAKEEWIRKGDTVHVKNDLSKHRARDFYLVTSVNDDDLTAEIQKFSGNILKSKKYVVKFNELYLASPHVSRDQILEDDDECGIPLCKFEQFEQPPPDPVVSPTRTIRTSSRTRNHPEWLATDEIQRIEY